jgi:hypothetical protein
VAWFHLAPDKDHSRVLRRQERSFVYLYWLDRVLEYLTDSQVLRKDSAAYGYNRYPNKVAISAPDRRHTLLHVTNRQRAECQEMQEDKIKQTSWTWLVAGRPMECDSIPSHSRWKQEIFRFSTASRPALLRFFQLQTRHQKVKCSGYETDHPPLSRVQIKV